MFVKRVKRKCNVRGCKCTDCFAISRTREVGNTVIICKSCLSDALGVVDEMGPEVKSNIPATENIPYSSIFFNAKALGTTAQTVDDVSSSGKNEQETADRGQAESTPDTPVAEDVATTDTTTETEAPTETETPEDATRFACPVCGKEFDSERGLKTHARYCNALK